MKRQLYRCTSINTINYKLKYLKWNNIHPVFAAIYRATTALLVLSNSFIITFAVCEAQNTWLIRDPRSHCVRACTDAAAARRDQCLLFPAFSKLAVKPVGSPAHSCIKRPLLSVSRVRPCDKFSIHRFIPETYSLTDCCDHVPNPDTSVPEKFASATSALAVAVCSSRNPVPPWPPPKR